LAPSRRRARSSFAVTLGVWKALFLREALMRVARDRSGGVWMIVEPVAHIGFLMWLFLIGFRQRHVAGVDSSVFIMLGVLAFFLPRNMMNRGMRAVDASDALYSYRQVRPVDAVIARILVESLLGVLLFFVVIAGAALLGFPVYPADPLAILAALGGLWLAGLGMALTLSVLGSFSFEAQRTVRLLLGPLYVFSGVLFPSAGVPLAMRDWLLLNPLLHGVESVRMGFAPMYHAASGINLAYLYQVGMVLVFLGLALHVRYERFLVSR
jgi:capsular polysaccharide transport system permease protein